MICVAVKSLRFLLVAATFALVAGAAQASDPGPAEPEPVPVRILKGGADASSRSIVLPLHKAVIVELPVEVRDVLVANPLIADAVVRTSKRVYLLGQQAGATNAFFFDAEGKKILSIEIRVDNDSGMLSDTIKKFLPESNVKVEWLNDTVVLSGTAPSAIDADRARSIALHFVNGDDNKVLSMISVGGTEQVMLKVRVAEVQRTVAKQLGVDLEAMFKLGETSFDLLSVNPFTAGTTLNAVASTIGYSHGSRSIDSNIRALEQHGLLRMLAEPNLTAISGENAKFLAGGEFPVPASRDRDGNISIEFKQFGVALAFTPVVLSSGRVSLHISTEVSELQTEGSLTTGQAIVTNGASTTTIAGITIPALRVRRADTTLEMSSGGSLMMAGLLQNTTKQSIDALPGIKNVPVLGSLFQSRDFQNNETELVVIVTPYLVGQTTSDALRAPTDGLVIPTDLETIFLGKLNAVYGKGGTPPDGRRLEGPVGFIME